MITSIPNLGPATQDAFHKAGITTAEELRALGPQNAYRQLLRSGVRPHFIGYYVLVMGLQGRPWNDCKGAEKKQLRSEFDAIKAETYDSHLNDFERLMNQIGVRPGKDEPPN